MCCGEEAAILQRRLTPLAGIEDVAADIVGQRLHVKYDAAVLSTNAIVEAVAETGMRAWLEHEEPIVPPSSARARGCSCSASAVALAVGLAAAGRSACAATLAHRRVSSPRPSPAACFRRAARCASLRMRELDINVLMLVAVVGAMFLGEWAEAGTVVFLFAIAQWLESRSMDRAREAIRALMDLTPDEARIRHGDHEELVPVDRVPIGTVMIVRPGEKIPLDGEVVAGRSDVNQAPITGESLPVDKGAGRRGVRRHHQRPRRARSRGDAAAARHDARAHHSPRRDRAGAARARRSSSSIASRAGTRPAVIALAVARRDGAAAARRRVRDLVLSRAGAAGRVVPVRARDLDAGVDRVGAGRRRPARRAGEGRRSPRAARGGSRDRVRQDRNADARHAAGDGVRARGRRHRGRAACRGRRGRGALRASDRGGHRRRGARARPDRSRRGQTSARCRASAPKGSVDGALVVCGNARLFESAAC